jgi:hypothetical protein
MNRHQIIGTAFWAAATIAWAVLTPVSNEPPEVYHAWAFLIQLAIMVVVTIAMELLRPKPEIENARPGGLGDFNFPTATEGRVVPIVWGRVQLLAPNVIWYGAFTISPIRKKQKTGLFSSTTTTIGHKYNVGVQAALCRGPIDHIDAMHIGDEQVFAGPTLSSFTVDLPGFHGVEGTKDNGIHFTMDIHEGSDTQAPNDFLAVYQDAGAGTDRTPRYTGTTYVVLRAPDSEAAASAGLGGYIGNSPQMKPWKFEVTRYAALFSGQTGNQHIIGSFDCNPVNVLYEILTNTDWGLAFNPADIDVGAGSSFLDAADTCRTEGLGFSMVLTKAMVASDMIAEIERHMDGVLHLDMRTGLWKIKMARADYTIGTVPALTPDNVITVRDFSQGAWNETVNQVQVKFNQRDNEYKETYASSADSANYLIQGGGTVATGTNVSTKISYPGVKEASTAATMAWRELRSLSYPLARATFEVSREFWDVTIGDVVSWTDSAYGYTNLAMRVMRVDYGKLTDNTMTLVCIQDIFKYVAPSFGTPAVTGWGTPYATPVAYPTADQIAFEAPRLMAELHPDWAGSHLYANIMTAVRQQNTEPNFTTEYRWSAATPSGAYTSGDITDIFSEVGQLNKAIDVLGDPGQPTNSDSSTTIVLNTTPSSQSRILNMFMADGDSVTDDMQGTTLAHAIMIGDEIMTVDNATVSGSEIVLTGPKRGMMDTIQTTHAINAPVFMLTDGTSRMGVAFDNTVNVDVRFRMTSQRGVEYAGTPVTIGLDMKKRALRPYPIAGFLANGETDAYNTAPSLEYAGGNENIKEWTGTFRAKNYLNTNEVTALTTDDSTVSASTEYQLTIVSDPDGAANTVYTSAWVAQGTSFSLLRNLFYDQGADGTLCRVSMEARHDLTTPSVETNLPNYTDFTYDCSPTSATYSGLDYMGGAVAANVASDTHTATATGNYTIVSAIAVASGVVEGRINGGAWATVIATSGTSGIIAATSGDTIEYRRTVDYGSVLITVKNPSATAVAYGTLLS